MQGSGKDDDYYNPGPWVGTQTLDIHVPGPHDPFIDLGQFFYYSTREPLP